jgi:hypothetical protein
MNIATREQSIKSYETPYGRLIILVERCFRFVFVFSLFLCPIVFIICHAEGHIHDENENPTTVTATPGSISIHISDPDEYGSQFVISDSSINVDVDVSDKNENIIQTVSDLPPGGSFEIPPSARLITASAG